MVMSYALVAWLNTKRRQYSILPSKSIVKPTAFSEEDLPMEGEALWRSKKRYPVKILKVGDVEEELELA
uniref:Uncharacterized protein n=1 Tax=Amphimedon queenslandica TaxID=400682 RepID=A0A1X7V8P0_AMPQE